MKLRRNFFFSTWTFQNLYVEISGRNGLFLRGIELRVQV